MEGCSRLTPAVCVCGGGGGGGGGGAPHEERVAQL